MQTCDSCERHLDDDDTFDFNEFEEDDSKSVMTCADEMDAIRRLAVGRITDGASDEVLGPEAVERINALMASSAGISMQVTCSSPTWNGRGPEVEIREMFRRLTSEPDPDTVRKGYDALPNRKVRDRKKSAIKGVRNANNAVKKALMKECTQPGDVVLDLCCGKGGDLHKWTDLRVKRVVFADFARNSVEECQRRYEDTKSGRGEVKNRPPEYDADFVVSDCFSRTLQRDLPYGVKFDVVSCQMALHYSFQDQERARNALWNVNECLKPGGYFICTIPDSDVLYRRLMAVKSDSADPLSFGNRIYKVTFETNKAFPNFGSKYWFWLDEAVETLPEYLVPKKDLLALAHRYGLEFIKSASFEDYIAQSVDRDNLHLTPDDMEVISIYRAYVFRKRA